MARNIDLSGAFYRNAKYVMLSVDGFWDSIISVWWLLVPEIKTVQPSDRRLSDVILNSKYKQCQYDIIST